MNTKNSGVILLQTLIMVLILALIGVMTLKWGLGRYLITTRVSKSINCKALADACLAQRIASWNGGAPINNDDCVIDGKTIDVIVSGSEVKFVVNDKNCTYR